MVRKLSSWSIRTHLVILLLLLALPCIVVTVHSGIKARDEAIDEAKRERLRFVDSVATEQQSVVAGAQQLGAALSLLPEIRSGNREAASALLSYLLKTNPQYINIIVADKSGVVWASAAPFRGTISVADRRYFKEAARTGSFSSGEYSIGRIFQKPIMIFGYPVKGDTDQVIAVIGIILDLTHIQNTFEKIGVPAGTSVSLLDHQGVIFIRTLRDGLSGKLEGKRDIREDLFTRMKQGPDEGTFESVGNDNNPRLFAYRRTRLPGESEPYLYIRSSVPVASVMSKANSQMFKNLALLVLVFGAGLLLVGLIGKRVIANPVLLLKKASEQLSAGADTVNVSRVVKGGELGELARTFDDMAEVLARREASLRESEERYRRLFEDAVLGVFQSTPGGKIIAVNAAYARMFGYASADELMAAVSDVALDIYADPSRRPPIVEMIMEAGKSVRIENVYKRKDGSTFVGNLHAWSARNSRGDLILEGFVEDISDRRQAEEANARLAAIVQSSGDAIIGKDLSGAIIAWNKGAEKIYGYAPEEVINKPISILVPPDYADEVPNFLDRAGRGESVEHYETFRLRKDGRRIPVSLTMSPIKDASGTVVGVSTIARDITDRILAEQALKESEEKYRAAFLTSPDSVNINTMDGRYVDVNEGFTRMSGFTREDVIGVLSSQIGIWSTPEDREVLIKGLKETGAVDNLESVFRCKDGSLKTGLMSARVVKINNEPHILSITRDITERKRAENALRESEEQFKAIFDTASIGVAQAEPQNGRWLRVNRKMCDITGYSRDELLAMRVPEITHPDDREGDWKAFRSVVNGEIPNYTLEKRYVRKDGKVVWVNVNMTVIRDSAGQPVHTVATVEDISERRLAREQIETSLHEKEVLLKEIHHRVKNNLQVISSLLNMQTQYVHDPKDVDVFRASMDRVKSMALIHDKLYRSENLASIQFPGYVNDLVRGLFISYATNKNIELDLQVDPISLDIDNAIPLGLIINELVSNALKHAFPGGKAGTIAISLRARGRQMLVTVADNGTGFPEDLDFTNTPSLGMQLVITLVEQLDGTIELNRSNGTEFRIVFEAAGSH